MGRVEEVRVAVRPLERVAKLVGPEAFAEVRRVGAGIRRRLARRVFWNVNSTAAGGGVAEMLHPLVGYARSVGVDARWVVIHGSPDFFRVTKRLHHALHGSLGDGSPLDDAARAIYEETARANAAEIRPLLRPRDVVLLHDPQTLGMAAELTRAGPSSCGAATSAKTPRARRPSAPGASCCPT